MDASEIIALIGGIAGLVTAIGGIITLFRKINQDKADTNQKIAQGKRESRQIAAQESAKAIQSIASVNEELRAHMAEQSARITDQGKQLSDLTTRFTDVSRRHDVAVRHIAERERSIMMHWAGRPESVPPVPVMIIPDVMTADPTLKIVEHTRPQKKPPDDDDVTRIRDPTEDQPPHHPGVGALFAFLGYHVARW